MCDYKLGMMVETDRRIFCRNKTGCISNCNNNNICVGYSLGSKDISFLQKNVGNQHNMVAEALIYHIKLFNHKPAAGEDIIDA